MKLLTIVNLQMWKYSLMKNFSLWNNSRNVEGLESLLNKSQMKMRIVINYICEDKNNLCEKFNFCKWESLSLTYVKLFTNEKMKLCEDKNKVSEKFNYCNW